MSYILEALKKAEAERTLGAVPNIHARPLVTALSANRLALWQRPWMWLALMTLVLTPTVAFWINAVRTAPAAPMDAVLPTQAAPRPAASIAPMAAAIPAPPTAAAIPAPPTAAAIPAPPIDVVAPPKAAPQKPVKHKTKAEPAQSKASVPMPAQRKPSPPQDEHMVVTLRELPEHIQRTIPQLSIGGYIYSDNQADRSVLINKRLLRDGDQVAADLILEKMTPTGIIFNYKGYRYHTSY